MMRVTTLIPLPITRTALQNLIQGWTDNEVKRPALTANGSGKQLRDERYTKTHRTGSHLPPAL